MTSLGVTSAIRGEGRTTVALAMALIQAGDYGRRTLLVEMDGFLRPSLAHRLGAEAAPGLAEFLEGRASLPDVTQPVREGLCLIAAGNGSEGVLRLLRQALTGGLMRDLADGFDAVVADLPPLLDGSFTRLEAAEFGRLLVVVRASITPIEQVRAATSGLPGDPAFLLNGAQSKLPPWLRRMGAASPLS